MVSVVVPAFNEEAAIGETVRTIDRVLKDANVEPYEVIVVDDGSSDRTAEIAEACGARVIRKPQNIGYGHSLKIGIENAKYETIVIADGDGTYPFDRIPDLLKIYGQGFDMIVGQRTGRYYRETIFKHPLRVIFKWLVEFTVGAPVPDVNSGMRVFSKTEITKLFPTLSNSFSFTTSSTLAYAMRNKYIKYVPIDYHKRVGETKVRLFRDSLRALQYVIQAIVHYNPIKIFLVLALLVIGIGVVLIAAAYWFDSIILGALGGAAGLASLLIFAMGLLAEQLRSLIQRPAGDD